MAAFLESGRESRDMKPRVRISGEGKIKEMGSKILLALSSDKAPRTIAS
jgi:hypothetical protein